MPCFIIHALLGALLESAVGYFASRTSTDFLLTRLRSDVNTGNGTSLQTWGSGWLWGARMKLGLGAQGAWERGFNFILTGFFHKKGKK